MNECKSPRQSLTVMTRVVMPDMLNPRGSLFGGQLLSWMDELAGITALRHCGHSMPVTTAAVLKVDFLYPLVLGDMVTFHSKAVHAGHSSLTIFVDAVLETANEPLLAAHGEFLYVGLGADNRPMLIPGLVPETEEDQKNWERALQSKKHAELSR